MTRVMAYIDGFNLFYGLRDSGLRRYYWLNPVQLVSNLLKPNQTLMGVRYFTARVSASPSDPKKHLRQQSYLEALETIPNLDVVFGQYLSKQKSCRSCPAVWQHNEEKMTDVNIAVHLLTDAMDDAFDTAIIISADSDLVPPVQAVRGRFEGKRIIIASPPQRHSARLSDAANACFTIGRKKLADSQLPEQIAKPDGFVLNRPALWS